MSYNFYFAGSTSSKCTDKIRELGANQLLSQLERKAIKGWVEYLRENPECKSKLFIDSGAFTAHTKGKQIDVDEYINFINSIDDQVYIFAQVDCIPGTFGKERTDDEIRMAPQKSWENYLYMKDKVKSRDKLIPIFHMGEDFKWLHNMLNYTHEDGSPIWYIGISYAKDKPIGESRRWLSKCFDIIKSSNNPNVKTHCFGSCSRDTLEQFPFTSSDSTTWLQVAAMGNILIDNKSIYVSNQNTFADKNILNMGDYVINLVKDRLTKYNLTLDEVMESADARDIANIYDIYNWQNNYKYIGNSAIKNELF